MELRVLNYFLMVAREENITKAAQLLHITQPTLSRQLAQLENELGVNLFKRGNHNITLTSEGLLLKRRAQELIFLSEKTKREFHQNENISGEISIGSGEYKSTNVLSEMIASFHQQYPLVQFDIYSGNSDNIKEQIERGCLDFGLLLEPVDIRKYDFLRLPVKEEWGIFVSESSELAEKQTISPKDLTKYPIIFSGRKLVQNEIKNWFGCYSNTIDIVANGNLPYNLAGLARSKVGIFMSIKLNCQYDGLRFIPLSPPLQSATVLVWKKEQPYAPVTEMFLKHAQKYLKSIPDDTI